MASIGDSRTGMRNQTSIADLIVKGAIALVTAAFFIGAYLQFQVTFWLALIAALSVYITLLMLHTLMRRSERVDALATEVNRLEGELARVKGPGPAAYAAGARGPLPRSAAPPRPDLRPDLKSPPSPSGVRPQPPVHRAAPPAAMPKQAPPAPPAPPTLQYAPPAAAPSTLPYTPPTAQSGAARPPQPAPTLPGWPGAKPAAGAADPIPDYWSFRPERPEQTPLPDARRKEAAPPQGEREADLEAVQGMIKRLASEVSLGPRGGERPNQENVMRASVDALHSTADTMRAAATRTAPAAARRDGGPPSMPPPIAPGHARLSSVAEAVAAGRMEVRLEPVVGLADHQLHHYEVTVCPRDEKGAYLSLVGQDRQLARTGLLPLIDSARLKWAAQISKSFADEGQNHCVFSPASGESLATDRFLDELANAYRQREALAGELVLVFNQADVRNFGAEWSALTDMRDLGFRFALEGVTDLDYEFSSLRAAGFAFVKLEAASFLKGLRGGPGGAMAAAEVCRHMSEQGLAVIVGSINDEATRAAVVECGVPLGQGPLFGPPVTLGADDARGSGHAAA
jgi:cyclic-di-GMP phosphodiesterase TipF (flagellum assembly factor)